jgi:hypothetical protein
MQAQTSQAQPDSYSSHDRPHSLQYLSLRNSSPPVNPNQPAICRYRSFFCRCLSCCHPRWESAFSVIPYAPWTNPGQIVISIEAAHAFCEPRSGETRFSPSTSTQSTPRLCPCLSSCHSRRESAFVLHQFPHWSQFIIWHLTWNPLRSTLCPYSTHWHLSPSRSQS